MGKFGCKKLIKLFSDVFELVEFSQIGDGHCEPNLFLVYH